MLHIGIVAVGGPQWIGGVQYVNNLLRALQTLPDGHRPRISVFLSNESSGAAAVEELAGMRRFVVPPRSRLHPKELAVPLLERTPFRQVFARVRPHLPESATAGLLRVARCARREGVDVLFPLMGSIGDQSPMRWIGWWPDFQPWLHPEFYSDADRAGSEALANPMVREATLLVASSEETKAGYEAYFPRSHGSVRVLKFRSVVRSADLGPDPAAVCARYGIRGRFFVVPNQFWKHKNHLLFVEALARARRQVPEMEAVLSGLQWDWRFPDHPAQVMQTIRELGLDAAVHAVGVIPRGDLLTLMRSSVAVVQPSLAEGWSTVVEDARAVGVHLIVSDIPVHREQAAPEFDFFNPHDTSALADQLIAAWTASRPPRDFHETLAMQQGLVSEYARSFLDVAREAVLIGAGPLPDAHDKRMRLA